MILEYKEFKKLLKNTIKITPSGLLELIINNPDVYVSEYSIEDLNTKIIQNVSQSNTIKFGYFYEDMITLYIKKLGYKVMKKRYVLDNGKVLLYDQLFWYDDNTICIIEQKMRDNHDSTKKVGQIENFKEKIELMRNIHPNKKIIAVMWFVEGDLVKNKQYYLKEYESIPNDIDKRMYYGDTIFEDLIKNEEICEEIHTYLKQYKKEKKKKSYIINYDTSKVGLKALLSLSEATIKKLLSDTKKMNIIKEELFPTGHNLNILKEKFEKGEK